MRDQLSTTVDKAVDTDISAKSYPHLFNKEWITFYYLSNNSVHSL